MEMRHFYFDKYHTWYDWRLTLTAKDVTPPEPKTSYIDLDGRDGTLDLSEALTGGITYSDRTVAASFWTSEGKPAERAALLQQITTALHGRKVKIIEPDDPEHYFLGRVIVKPVVHDMVHTELDIEAICEPWRYSVNETERRVVVDDEAKVVIWNHGNRILCPDITVEGTVTLTFSGASVTLTTGAYKVTDIKLQHGPNVIGAAGNGTVVFTYREAML